MRVAFVVLSSEVVSVSSELKVFPSPPSPDSKPVEVVSLVEAWLFLRNRKHNSPQQEKMRRVRHSPALA